MAKIDIKETGEQCVTVATKQAMAGRSPSSKSPSPARRDAAPHPPGIANTSSESGYFEGEESEGSDVRENSIEIIFDKNATNNNSGNKAAENGETGKVLLNKL